MGLFTGAVFPHGGVPENSPSAWMGRFPSLIHPEGPARHLDVSGQEFSPHCLETIFDSQLPSPKSSPKMPPKLSLPHRRGHFFFFQNYPCGEGNCEAIERQKLSRGNFCPGTSRCLAGPTGHVFLDRVQQTVSGSAPPQHPPDTSSIWTLFRCSRREGLKPYLANRVWRQSPSIFSRHHLLDIV